MITFEFPLNERIRRLLRIEEIYQKSQKDLKDYETLKVFLIEITKNISENLRKFKMQPFQNKRS